MKLILVRTNHDNAILDNLDQSLWSFRVRFGDNSLEADNLLCISNQKANMNNSQNIFDFYDKVKFYEDINKIQLYVEQDGEDILMFDSDIMNLTYNNMFIQYNYQENVSMNEPFLHGLSIYIGFTKKK